MKRLFWGFIFIFFDFFLQIGDISIGVLPDFVGYFLIVSGLRRLPDDNYEFQKIRPIALIAAVLSTVIYFVDFFGISAKLGFIATCLEFCFTALTLYICYTIIFGIRELEKQHNVDLLAKKLRVNWMILVVAQLIPYITMWVPKLFLIGMVFSIAFTFSFLITFNASKRAYGYVFEF